jgi:hypothetical protein
MTRESIEQLIDDLVAADRKYIELCERRRSAAHRATIDSLEVQAHSAWIVRERTRDALIDAAAGVTS